MTPAQLHNAALTEVSEILTLDYCMTPEQIAAIVADIPGECEAIAARQSPKWALDRAAARESKP